MKIIFLKFISILLLFLGGLAFAQSSDLQITNSATPSYSAVGGTIVFTITAKNNGPNNNNVKVNDLLNFTNYQYVSNVATVGSYTYGDGLWTIGTLNNGATATLSITVKLLVGASTTNTATISTTSGISDPNAANNTSTVTVNLDSDGDGIPDAIDVDSDNDGILDNVECVVLKAAKQDFAAGTITTITANSHYKQTVGPFSVDYTNIGSSTIQSYTESTTTAAEFYAIGTSVSYVYPDNGANQVMKLSSPAFIQFAVTDIDQPGEKDRIKVYDENGVLYPDPSIFITKTGLGTAGASFPGTPTIYNDLGTNVSKTAGVGYVDIAIITSSSQPTFQRANMAYFDFSQNKVSRIDVNNTGTGGQPGFLFNEIRYCPDTDGDGIPDYLDLDSDNDGCSDAIEGGADITNSQLVTAGGTVTVGTGSTAQNQNLCASGTCVNAQGLPQFTTLPTGYSNTTGQGIGSSQDASINSCICYNPAAGGTGVATNHGITLLQKAGVTSTDWPMVRTSAHTVLESNTKGFVITRMTSDPSKSADANYITKIVDPQDGMMVYDTFSNCLKIYTVEVSPAVTGWKCYLTPTCP